MEHKLNIIERRILANQYEILQKLSALQNDAHGVNINLRYQHILNEGYIFEYTDLLRNDSSVSYKVCREVRDIFNMYHSLEFAIKEFDIDTASYHFASFKGFDGNEEFEHIGYGCFVTEELDLYGWVKDKPMFPGLNSHMPTLKAYRAMLVEWHTSKFKHRVTEDEAIKILKEGNHS